MYGIKDRVLLVYDRALLILGSFDLALLMNDGVKDRAFLTKDKVFHGRLFCR